MDDKLTITFLCKKNYSVYKKQTHSLKCFSITALLSLVQLAIFILS